MSKKRIVLKNHKGGVGKTTLSLHIAIGLALRNRRVLLIDTDPQGHISNQLDMAEFGGLYRLLVQQAEWREVLRQPSPAAWCGMEATIGELLVVSSNLETRAIPLMIDNPLVLRERLAELEGRFDAVIFDTSPTPSLLQNVVDLASDYALLPSKCEMLSLDGLKKTTNALSQQNAARQSYGIEPIELLGVIPTMYRDTNSNIYGRDLLEEHFGAGMVWDPIPLRTIWTDREYARQSIFTYAPRSEAADEMTRVIERLLNYVA